MKTSQLLGSFFLSGILVVFITPVVTYKPLCQAKQVTSTTLEARETHHVSTSHWNTVNNNAVPKDNVEAAVHARETIQRVSAFQFTDPLVYVQLSVLLLIQLFCTSIGVVGGAFYVAVLAFHCFHIFDAIAICQAMIVVEGTLGTVWNIYNQYTFEIPYVDLGLLKILAPGLVLGTALGLLTNMGTNTLLVIILVTLVLFYVVLSLLLFRKGFKSFQSETLSAIHALEYPFLEISLHNVVLGSASYTNMDLDASAVNSQIAALKLNKINELKPLPKSPILHESNRIDRVDLINASQASKFNKSSDSNSAAWKGSEKHVQNEGSEILSLGSTAPPFLQRSYNSTETSSGSSAGKHYKAAESQTSKISSSIENSKEGSNPAIASDTNHYGSFKGYHIAHFQDPSALAKSGHWKQNKAQIDATGGLSSPEESITASRATEDPQFNDIMSESEFPRYCFVFSNFTLKSALTFLCWIGSLMALCVAYLVFHAGTGYLFNISDVIALSIIIFATLITQVFFVFEIYLSHPLLLGMSKSEVFEIFMSRNRSNLRFSQLIPLSHRLLWDHYLSATYSIFHSRRNQCIPIVAVVAGYFSGAAGVAGVAICFLYLELGGFDLKTVNGTLRVAAVCSSFTQCVYYIIHGKLDVLILLFYCAAAAAFFTLTQLFEIFVVRKTHRRSLFYFILGTLCCPFILWYGFQTQKLL